MDKNLAEMWVDALRSGKYKQGRKCLQDYSGSFCCLGVLADLMEKPTMARSKKQITTTLGYPADMTSYASNNPQEEWDCWPLQSNGGSISLSKNEIRLIKSKISSWKQPLGLCSGKIALSSLNDAGLSFSDIADLIEAHADEL